MVLELFFLLRDSATQGWYVLDTLFLQWDPVAQFLSSHGSTVR